MDPRDLIAVIKENSENISANQNSTVIRTWHVEDVKDQNSMARLQVIDELAVARRGSPFDLGRNPCSETRFKSRP
jgi:hypothetical protein